MTQKAGMPEQQAVMARFDQLDSKLTSRIDQLDSKLDLLRSELTSQIELGLAKQDATLTRRMVWLVAVPLILALLPGVGEMVGGLFS